MIIDASTYVGHWPFRALPHRTVRDLLRQMNEHGIDKAVVSSIHAMFYKNAHEANHELHRETRRHRDRLIPFGTLNPTYPGWEDDMRQCRETFGMPGLRLIPQYHGYTLADACATEIVKAATELKMVVSLSGRIVDRRPRSPHDHPQEITDEQILTLFRRTREARYLLVNTWTLLYRRLPKQPVVWMDTCRYRAAPSHDLENLIKGIGSDRVVFGSSMLLRYPKPALIEMELLKASKVVKEKIYSRNLAKLLGLKIG